MVQHVYLTVRVDIPKESDPEELSAECDYSVTHPTIEVLDTEIVGYEVKQAD